MTKYLTPLQFFASAKNAEKLRKIGQKLKFKNNLKYI